MDHVTFEVVALSLDTKAALEEQLTLRFSSNQTYEDNSNLLANET